MGERRLHCYERTARTFGSSLLDNKQDPFDGDLSVKNVMPEVAVDARQRACAYCDRRLLPGALVAIVQNMPNGPWTSVETRAEREARRRAADTR
jgi:hypothetical protein